jgi:hypothetical protein
MLTKSVIKRIREEIASARKNIRNYRAVSVIAKQLEPLVAMEGWKTRVQSNSFTVEKEWGFKPEGETDMQYFLNMCGIIKDALGQKLDIKIGTHWNDKPELSAHLIIEVKPRISQHLPTIRAPKVVVRDKTWIKGNKLIQPQEANRVYVFVRFGETSDCEFVVEETVETVTNKTIKLTGACAEAIASMN